MNVLFLSSWYPSKVSPKNGNFIQQHARAVSNYCKVAALHVISAEQNKDIVIEKGWNKDVFEVVVYYRKIHSRLPIISQLQKLSRQKAAYNIGYTEILKELGKIELVHLNVFFPAGIFALELKKRYNLPFVTTEHWTAYLKSSPLKISPIEKWYIKKIARQSSFICPVSHDLKQALIDNGITGKYQVIPNVVAPFFFEKEGVLPREKIRILHISTFKDDHKNITGILSVIKKLSESRTDFELYMVGDGDPAPHTKLAEDLKLLNKYVFFEGPKSSKEIATIMKNADLFVLFSNYENQPCVILEALACGVPVISSNVGGIAEVINDSNGMLVAARNEKALQSAISKMLDNYKSYDRDAIRESARQKFSYEQVGKQLFQLYDQVLKS